jgi:hypothetical protein
MRVLRAILRLALVAGIGRWAALEVASQLARRRRPQ